MRGVSTSQTTKQNKGEDTMGLFDPVEPIDSEYESWIRDVISHIFPTWHGYTYDHDRLDSKGLPYYKKGFSPEKAAALLHDHTQIMEAVEAELDSTTTIH